MSTPDFSSLTEADVRDNPQLDQHTLMNLAQSRPDLRAVVRQHPNCYQGLAEWIDAQSGLGQQPQQYAPTQYGQPGAGVVLPKGWSEWLPVIIAGLAVLGLVALFLPLVSVRVDIHSSSVGFFAGGNLIKEAKLVPHEATILAIISMVLVIVSAAVSVAAFFARRRTLSLTYPIVGIVAGAMGLTAYIVGIAGVNGKLSEIRRFAEALGASWETEDTMIGLGFGSFFGLVVFGLLLVVSVLVLIMELKGRDLRANIRPAVFVPGSAAQEASGQVLAEPMPAGAKRGAVAMPFMVAGLAALAFATVFIPAYVLNIEGHGGPAFVWRLEDPVLILAVISMALSLVSATLSAIAIFIRLKPLQVTGAMSGAIAGVAGVATYIVFFPHLAMMNDRLKELEYSEYSFAAAPGAFIGLTAFSILLIGGSIAAVHAFRSRGRSEGIG